MCDDGGHHTVALMAFVHNGIFTQGYVDLLLFAVFPHQNEDKAKHDDDDAVETRSSCQENLSFSRLHFNNRKILNLVIRI